MLLCNYNDLRGEAAGDRHSSQCLQSSLGRMNWPGTKEGSRAYHRNWWTRTRDQRTVSSLLKIILRT